MFLDYLCIFNRPGSRVDQVDWGRLGPFKSGQVGLLNRHRRDFLAPWYFYKSL